MALEQWQIIIGEFIVNQNKGIARMIKETESMESPLEKVMYIMLYQVAQSYGFFNFSIHPQYPIGNYKADFLVYCDEKYIVIECDGHDFHEKTKEQAARDKKRDREMQKQGYIVLRYTGSEIFKDPERVCYDLQTILGHPDWASDGDKDG